ncbi:unannotated protein [freshwater metagenome]|uniref:Unannotated protein n=1 Tax=freshwater metagenome TaxID=449393 RepID=A0A6J6A0N7_9ZZZZ
MLGVEQHAFAFSNEEGDRLGDHREILVWGNADDLLDVQHRRLSNERHNRRDRSRQYSQSFVLLGRAITAARHAEGNDLGVVERGRGEQFEELGLFRI